MPTDGLELVANIWPIADARTMVIHRFAARAYVMDVRHEANVSAMLKHLAQTDFYAAKQYPIHKRFSLNSEHGTVKGCIVPAGFNRCTLEIVDPVLEDLRLACPDPVGICTAEGEPRLVASCVRFGRDPYLVITYLFEDPHGNLTSEATDRSSPL